jgi:hypothetical protein
MLIASQRPDATRVAGYQKWREFGRFVKKGAKGIFILAPILAKKTTLQDSPVEENAKIAVGFRAVYVFDGLSWDFRESEFTRSVGKYRAEEGFFDG